MSVKRAGWSVHQQHNFIREAAPKCASSHKPSCQVTALVTDLDTGLADVMETWND
jgi:hypothetical protein